METLRRLQNKGRGGALMDTDGGFPGGQLPTLPGQASSNAAPGFFGQGPFAPQRSQGIPNVGGPLPDIPPPTGVVLPGEDQQTAGFNPPPANFGPSQLPTLPAQSQAPINSPVFNGAGFPGQGGAQQAPAFPGIPPQALAAFLGRPAAPQSNMTPPAAPFTGLFRRGR